MVGKEGIYNYRWVKKAFIIMVGKEGIIIMVGKEGIYNYSG